MKKSEKKKLYWVDFEMDNSRDTANGGAGNWYPVEVEGEMLEEALADVISDQTGWCVYQIETEKPNVTRKEEKND
tara:strand:- start:317 stop:541 length:225 start_codon:yes stop_codon:yes gene_type:complete